MVNFEYTVRQTRQIACSGYREQDTMLLLGLLLKCQEFIMKSNYLLVILYVRHE